MARVIDKCVQEVRAFNRFYTVYLGILNNSYLHSKFSLAEVRVMYAAIIKPGVTPTEIVASLNVDKSYLSRMIVRLERMKVIARKKSKADGRSFNLYITASGRKAFDKLDAIATKEMHDMLQHLSERECELLMNSMAGIQRILSSVSLASASCS